MEGRTNRRPLIAAGLLLGVGLGGFVDGIVFHQILQWHNMLTGPGYYPKAGVDPETVIRNMQVNMFWDCLFHAFTWLTTAVGLALLWRAGQRPDVPWSTRTFLGSLPLGWGLFNLVEGVIDHHILHVHHVVEGPGHLAWDIGFLASGLVLIALGWTLVSSGRRDRAVRGEPQPEDRGLAVNRQ
jgi:uncharacterized membrane protein